MDASGGYQDYDFVAEFYDHVTPYQSRADVAFYVEMATESGGPVLELGCGTGRVLIPIARAGISITGLDLSSRMLSVCVEKLAGEPEAVRARVHLAQGDMRHPDLRQTFRLVTIPFRPFQHLVTVEDQIACLTSIHALLAPGGRLILDVFNPYLPRLADEKYMEETGDEPPFTMPDGRVITRRNRLTARDLFNQVLQSELIYYVSHPDGRQERLVHAFPMRYLFRFEVEHLLARCGFRLETVYADYDRSPYGSKYPGELIAMARKARGAQGGQRVVRL